MTSGSVGTLPETGRTVSRALPNASCAHWKSPDRAASRPRVNSSMALVIATEAADGGLEACGLRAADELAQPARARVSATRPERTRRLPPGTRGVRDIWKNVKR